MRRTSSRDRPRALARLGVLAGDVEALDDHEHAALERRAAVAGAERRWGRVAAQDVLDLAPLAGVPAREDDDGVALADLGHLGPLLDRPDGHHSTSGASETIFM